MTLQPRNYISVASIALFLGGLLWIAAFWFPVFKTAEREIAGYWIFVSGWMGFVIFQFAWYANLLVLIAVILMYTAPVKATLFAALGLLVATQAFWFDVLPETTQSVAITAKGLGFWFWYAGIFLMSVGVFFCLDTDEVTDVIETPEPDTGIVSLRAAAVAGMPVHQPAPEPEILTEPEPESEPKEPVPEVIATEPSRTETLLARAMRGLPAHEAVLPVVESELSDIKGEEEAPVETPEPFVLNKTDEELEATVPVITAILQAAVFPEIKKPEQQN